MVCTDGFTTIKCDAPVLSKVTKDICKEHGAADGSLKVWATEPVTGPGAEDMPVAEKCRSA